MPMYDRRCSNGHDNIDCLEPIVAKEVVPCRECGASTERVWIGGRTAAVIPDEIPGGVWIKHGICNPDGSPRKYYSKSEMAKEAQRRGLVNVVEHRTGRDTDKSSHTTRWV